MILIILTCGIIKKVPVYEEELKYFYANYKDCLKGSPIESVAGGIVLRAGWHSMIHDCDLFAEFEWLSDAITKAKVSINYRTPLLFQVFVKIYNRFRRCRK